MKKIQTWLQTDIDYFSTIKKLKQSQLITDTGEYRGKFTFYLKNAKQVAFQITTGSYLSISYPGDIAYEQFFEQIKPMLVKADGTSAQKFDVTTEPKSRKISFPNKDLEDEIQYWTTIITSEKKDQDNILRGMKRLRILTEKNIRIAHLPNVLPAYNKALDDQEIITANSQILWQLALALRNILRVEREHKFQESESIIETISNGILDKFLDLVKQVSDFPDKYTIEFLGECTKEKVVDVLFFLVRKFKDKLARHQVEPVGLALRDFLYSDHRQIIIEQVDDLRKSDDSKLIAIARILDQILLWA